MSVLIRDRSIERDAVVSPFERPGRLCAVAVGLGAVTLLLSACAPLPMGEPGFESPAAPGALARHRAWQDTEPLAWPAANEAVRQVGGWRAYAREGQPGSAAPAAPATPADPDRSAPVPVAPR